MRGKGGGVADALRLHLGFESVGSAGHVGLTGEGRPSVDVFFPRSVSACAQLLLLVQRWIAHAERPPQPTLGRGLSGLTYHKPDGHAERQG